MAEVDLSNVNRLYTVLLLKSCDMHGYQLMEEIEKVTGKKPSSSHIYPFLNKLRENGFAEAREEGERNRKKYSLTPEGQNLVAEQIDSFGEILAAVIEDRVEDCSHCDCEIYGGGYEENGNVYCCKHCAEADLA